MGINTWVSSWVANYCIHGMGRAPRRGVHHFRPAHRLGKTQGQLPAHGCITPYCPADVAIVSLNELRGSDYQLSEEPAASSIDEIISGSILGRAVL